MATATTAYRVYLAQDGSDLVFCGECATRSEAEALADSQPAGLERSLWDTARAAGHCGGLEAPSAAGEESELLSWHGANHCVVRVTYTLPDQRISISCDGVWAGEGRLVDGQIIDCPAVLGADQDASDVCYEAIQDAIEDGDDSLEHAGHTYTWTIE